MITTRDLQEANKAVTTARNAVPFDQAAYDEAHAAYMALIEQWAKEGKDAANDARKAMKGE